MATSLVGPPDKNAPGQHLVRHRAEDRMCQIQVPHPQKLLDNIRVLFVASKFVGICHALKTNTVSELS